MSHRASTDWSIIRRCLVYAMGVLIISGLSAGLHICKRRLSLQPQVILDACRCLRDLMPLLCGIHILNLLASNCVNDTVIELSVDQAHSFDLDAELLQY